MEGVWFSPMGPTGHVIPDFRPQDPPSSYSDPLPPPTPRGPRALRSSEAWENSSPSSSTLAAPARAVVAGRSVSSAETHGPSVRPACLIRGLRRRPAAFGRRPADARAGAAACSRGPALDLASPRASPSAGWAHRSPGAVSLVLAAASEALHIADDGLRLDGDRRVAPRRWRPLRSLTSLRAPLRGRGPAPRVAVLGCPRRATPAPSAG